MNTEKLGTLEEVEGKRDMTTKPDDMKKMIDLANNHIAECKSLQDQVEGLRVKLSIQKKDYEGQLEESRKEIQRLKARLQAGEKTIQEQKKTITRLEAQIKSLQQSLVRRVGKVVVAAIKEPGVKTLLCPLRVIRIVIKHRKQKKG